MLTVARWLESQALIDTKVFGRGAQPGACGRRARQSRPIGNYENGISQKEADRPLGDQLEWVAPVGTTW